jgi:predicted polyphosphate/ATP-dependent NAD kinase
LPPEERSFTIAEVLDRNEGGAPQLFGTMRVPRDPRRMQPAKASPAVDDLRQIEGACQNLAAMIRSDERVTIVGPGSSTLELKHLLSSGGTLLGVDIYGAGRLVVEDADEHAILSTIEGRPARLILGVIGGQGFLIGRGNQQISPAVLRRVGLENIVALASSGKLAQLPDRTLYADTGDDILDVALAGYVPVQVSGSRRVIMPLNSHLRRTRGAHLSEGPS